MYICLVVGFNVSLCVCILQWIRNLSWQTLVWFKMTKTKVPMCANFTEKINLLQSSPWYEASVISNCKYKSQNAPWYEAGVTSWEGQAQSWEAWSSPSKLICCIYVILMTIWSSPSPTLICCIYIMLMIILFSPSTLLYFSVICLWLSSWATN